MTPTSDQSSFTRAELAGGEGVGVPADAVGLRLHKFVGERLIACEAVRFVGGAKAVELTLRRAAISGHVQIDGEIKDHFADLLDASGTIVETVALDAKSYRSLKNRWARCKLEAA